GALAKVDGAAPPDDRVDLRALADREGDGLPHHVRECDVRAAQLAGAPHVGDGARRVELEDAVYARVRRAPPGGERELAPAGEFALPPKAHLGACVPDYGSNKRSRLPLSTGT